MAKYIIKSRVPLTNFYIEQFVKYCGYCELKERKFLTYSSDRYTEYELHIEVSILKVHGLKHDINKLLKQNYKQNCKKFWTIERARK